MRKKIFLQRRKLKLAEKNTPPKISGAIFSRRARRQTVGARSSKRAAMRQKPKHTRRASNATTTTFTAISASRAKPSSVQHYRFILRRYIAPQLGTIKVQDLSPAILDKWIRGLQRQGLSYRTISGVRSVLSSALKYAVYPAQLIAINPVEYIKVTKNAPRDVIKRIVMTPEQFTLLLSKHPHGTQYHVLFLLLYYTGMRLGEALGLKWNNIDFKAKRINVRRQMAYLSKQGISLPT